MSFFRGDGCCHHNYGLFGSMSPTIGPTLQAMDEEQWMMGEKEHSRDSFL